VAALPAIRRLRPIVAVRVASPNYSGRQGRVPVLIVVHDTEAANRPGSHLDLVGVANFLCRPEVQASAHVCTDADGRSARIVGDHLKAWHCAAFNGISLGVEQVGWANQTTWSDVELLETARWLARWSKRYGIPLRAGAVSGLTVITPGVVTHAQLGPAGGGHHDPGEHYPLRRLLRLARRIRGRL
jgi:N-acetyl-anhydromuramyl-L-alanine amidase AmpD